MNNYSRLIIDAANSYEDLATGIGRANTPEILTERLELLGRIEHLTQKAFSTTVKELERTGLSPAEVGLTVLQAAQNEEIDSVSLKTKILSILNELPPKRPVYRDTQDTKRPSLGTGETAERWGGMARYTIRRMLEDGRIDGYGVLNESRTRWYVYEDFVDKTLAQAEGE